MLNALRLRAEAQSIEPWLFYPFPRGWKWLSFEQAWGRVRALQAASDEVDAEDGESLDPTVESVLLEVARDAPLGLAERLSDQLKDLPSRSSHADVTVLSPPVTTDLERTILAWSALSGAALLLEPNSAAFLATAAWARPTVLGLVTEEEVARLRDWAESSKTGPRSPFGRLRALVVPASLEISSNEREFWEQRSVQWVALAD